MTGRTAVFSLHVCYQEEGSKQTIDDTSLVELGAGVLMLFVCTFPLQQNLWF
jgi:hypothetical protein